jgi:uncharacterized protein YndB with AHSA1/START domain
MPTAAIHHATYSIEKYLPVSRSKAFAAFSDPAAKRRWFADDGQMTVIEHVLDFRVGGTERSRFRAPIDSPMKGAEFRNDTTYFHIVRDSRIVLAYSMAVEGRCISVSLATFDFVASGQGTSLRFTEQAAFLEGSDGPVIREQGWNALFRQLEAALADAKR